MSFPRDGRSLSENLKVSQSKIPVMETNRSEIKNELEQQIEIRRMETKQSFFDKEKSKSSHQPVSVNSSTSEFDSLELESKAANATLTTSCVPEASYFRPSLSKPLPQQSVSIASSAVKSLSPIQGESFIRLSLDDSSESKAANVTLTTVALSSFEEEEEPGTIVVPDKCSDLDDCSTLTAQDILSGLPCPLKNFMTPSAIAKSDATLLEQLNSQQEFLGLMDEKLDSHHSEAMDVQLRNHSEAMDVQRRIMERQSSNHSEAMDVQQAMYSNMKEFQLKVIQLLERGQTRAATDEQLKVLIQEMKTLQEKHVIDQKFLDELWNMTCDDDGEEWFDDECLRTATPDSVAYKVKAKIEMLKAKRELLEEKVKANRENAEVVARQSAASKTTGGRTHKANKSVRFRDVSNTQSSKTQLSRSKNYTKGIAPDCLKRADAKKEGTLSRRQEIERTKAKNSLPSMRF